MILFMQAKPYAGRWPAASRRRQARSLRRTAEHIVAVLREWRQRRRGRGALARFDDRMLRDIGLTRCDAANEIDKPFWRE